MISPVFMKNYINGLRSVREKVGLVKVKKIVYILLVISSVLTLYPYVVAKSSLLQLNRDEAALIRLNGKDYCFLRFEGVNTTGGTLWLYTAEKGDVNKLINASRLSAGGQYLITLEQTEVKVILKSIIGENAAIFELRTDLHEESIDTVIEKIGEGTSASFLPASIFIGASFIAAALCFVQGMTIGASTMAEKGVASAWSIALNISGLIILLLGFFAGLAALIPDVVPLFTISAAILLIGLALLTYITASSGSRSSVKRSRD
jgi:hypothetical protein